MTTKRISKSLPPKPPVPTGLVALDVWCAEKSLSATCVYRWIKQGKLAAVFLPGHGRRYFIKPVDAERLLKPIPAAKAGARALL